MAGQVVIFAKLVITSAFEMVPLSFIFAITRSIPYTPTTERTVLPLLSVVLEYKGVVPVTKWYKHGVKHVPKFSNTETTNNII